MENKLKIRSLQFFHANTLQKSESKNVEYTCSALSGGGYSNNIKMTIVVKSFNLAVSQTAVIYNAVIYFACSGK